MGLTAGVGSLRARAECTDRSTVLHALRGNGYLRRLLVNGAMSVLCCKQAKQDPWLVKLLETKERKVAACALANKMARIGWAVMRRQGDFRGRRYDQPCPDLREPGAVLAVLKTARGITALQIQYPGGER